MSRTQKVYQGEIYDGSTLHGHGVGQMSGAPPPEILDLLLIVGVLCQ